MDPMDPKIVLIMSIILTIIGGFVENLFLVIGLIKIPVVKNSNIGTIYSTAKIISSIGWAIILILMVTNGNTIIHALRCLF